MFPRNESDLEWAERILDTMKVILRRGVEDLWATGEDYPVVVVVDGATMPARRLKRLLPQPAGESPDEPGRFAAYNHATVRRHLQDVLGRGYLLDAPGNAEPGSSHWEVFIIGKELTVQLVTRKDGTEHLLRDSKFLIRS